MGIAGKGLVAPLGADWETGHWLDTQTPPGDEFTPLLEMTSEEEGQSIGGWMCRKNDGTYWFVFPPNLLPASGSWVVFGPGVRQANPSVIERQLAAIEARGAPHIMRTKAV